MYETKEEIVKRLIADEIMESRLPLFIRNNLVRSLYARRGEENARELFNEFIALRNAQITKEIRG